MIATAADVVPILVACGALVTALSAVYSIRAKHQTDAAAAGVDYIRAAQEIQNAQIMRQAAQIEGMEAEIATVKRHLRHCEAERARMGRRLRALGDSGE